MFAHDPNQSLWRKARFESFEQRLVLSAQPLGEMVVDNLDAAQTPADYGEIAPALADSNQASGVDYAHDNFGFTGKGQTVAVIDSGIAYDHTDLGGGYGADARVIGGWDFAENDADPYDDGPSGYHGTHVAGIVGSDDEYHTGVAPEADLVALRVFDDYGYGELEWVEEALQWVIDNRVEYNITTVNLSIGTTWNADDVPDWATLEEEFQQLENSGVFISVAAGNSYTSYNDTGLSYPAASPYVVPVASHNSKDVMSSFSQRNDTVLVAPGEKITSTIPSHVFGGSGPSSYFMSASGTSMAAPYVAGASVIMREAMAFAGYENITQDMIYDQFYDTADLIYDSLTNANYHQLNLASALDALLVDEYGSSAATAHSLGTLQGGTSVAGMIGRLDDVDYFTFTAAASGTMTFATEVDYDMVSDWTLVGGGGANQNGTLTFDVQAGQSYTISLGSSAGLGHYEIDVSLQSAAMPAATDWGIVSATRHDGQNIAGDKWYQFTATRDGIMSVEALFNHAAGNIDVELYDSNNQLLATGNSLNNDERIDVTASAGETFYLRVRGANADVDFRLTNLVTVNGDVVDVYGTAGNDTFTFAAGAVHQVSVNGVAYQFNGATTRTINLHGQGGSDQATLTGTAEREVATMLAGSADFEGTTWLVSTDSIETATFNGGGGGDWARFYDSAGDDVLTAQMNGATLTGAGFSNTANGFDRVYAHATSGGNDRANLYDSSGSDRFDARPDYSILRGDQFYHYAEGFESVFAYASGGGDEARLYDSAGNEIVVSNPGQSSMSGVGFYNNAQGFGETKVYVNGGGVDTIQASPSAPSNTLFVAAKDSNGEPNADLAAEQIQSTLNQQQPANSQHSYLGDRVGARDSESIEHFYSDDRDERPSDARRTLAVRSSDLTFFQIGMFDESRAESELADILSGRRDGEDRETAGELRAVDAVFGKVGEK